MFLAYILYRNCHLNIFIHTSTLFQMGNRLVSAIKVLSLFFVQILFSFLNFATNHLEFRFIVIYSIPHLVRSNYINFMVYLAACLDNNEFYSNNDTLTNSFKNLIIYLNSLTFIFQKF